MRNALIKYAKDHFIGFLFSLTFGGALTISLFYFTSSPTTTLEIKKQLVVMISNELKSRHSVEKAEISFNSIVSESLDLSTVNSIFTFGTAVESNDETIRFLAIFEPGKKNIFDKLVGRSAFYDLKSFTYIGVPYSNNMLPEDIKIIDIDLDGNKDIFVDVKSIWADSASTGLIVLKKDKHERWDFFGLPSLSSRLAHFTSGNSQHPDGLSPAASPNVWFGDTRSRKPDTEKILENYKGYGIYEDDWTALHNGKERRFITLRNGGKIKLLEHPYANYKHIGVASYVSDGYAVQDYHRVMVTFFKFGQDQLLIDELWNWGYPMLSINQEDLSVLEMDVFHSYGLSSHVMGETFFGYTEFGRITEH